MVKKVIVLYLLVFPSLLFSSGYPEGKATLFSKFKVRITYDNTPIAGAKITREYNGVGSDDYITEVSYTGENGEFIFEEAKVSLGIMGFLPHEAVIFQSINVEYKGEDYLLWYGVKRNYDYLGELKYYENDPILSSEMKSAYDEGYVYLNADLSRVIDLEGSVQQVDDDISVISVINLDFPYEDTLKMYREDLVTRKEVYSKPIVEWFSKNTDLNRLLGDSENWHQLEVEGFEPYIDAKITGVETVIFSDYLSLWFYAEDYDKEEDRVTLSGEIIVNIESLNREKNKARIWLRDSIFKVIEDKVIFNPQEDNFSVNSLNINP